MWVLVLFLFAGTVIFQHSSLGHQICRIGARNVKIWNLWGVLFVNEPCFTSNFCNLTMIFVATNVNYCLRSQGEAIILEILKGYQAFTQVVMFIARGFPPVFNKFGQCWKTLWMMMCLAFAGKHDVKFCDITLEENYSGTF